VDPVTGVLAPVVGARLDVSRKTIVPVTVSNWLSMCDHVDTVQVGSVEMFLTTHTCMFVIHDVLLCDTAGWVLRSVGRRRL